MYSYDQQVGYNPYAPYPYPYYNYGPIYPPPRAGSGIGYALLIVTLLLLLIFGGYYLWNYE